MLALNLPIKGRKVKVYYESAGVDKKGIIFLFHGIMTSSEFFEPVLKSELAKEYKLYALTWPWFGAHDKEEDNVCSFEGLTELAKVFVDHFKPKSFFIIGHSLGANVLLNALRNVEFSAKVKKVIFVSGFLKKEDINVWIRRYAKSPTLLPRAHKYILNKVLKLSGVAYMKSVAAAFATVSPQRTKIALRTAEKFTRKRSFYSILKEVSEKIPVLWITGEKDITVNLHGNIPSGVKQASFHGGHRIPMTDTEEFVRYIEEFFV